MVDGVCWLGIVGSSLDTMSQPGCEGSDPYLEVQMGWGRSAEADSFRPNSLLWLFIVACNLRRRREVVVAVKMKGCTRHQPFSVWISDTLEQKRK